MIYKIGLTGGPCAGKSSALAAISSAMAEDGIMVVAAPEAATQIINEGMMPGTAEFQLAVFKRQLELERVANIKAASIDNNGQDVVVVYDRTSADQLAYVSYEMFANFIDLVGLTIDQIIYRYTVVIHMVSAAVDTNAYTTANNNARGETREQAVAMEEKTLRGNKKVFGSNLVVVDNSTGFDEKIQAVVAHIRATIAKKRAT